MRVVYFLFLELSFYTARWKTADWIIQTWKTKKQKLTVCFRIHSLNMLITSYSCECNNHKGCVKLANLFDLGIMFPNIQPLDSLKKQHWFTSLLMKLHKNPCSISHRFLLQWNCQQLETLISEVSWSKRDSLSFGLKGVSF